MLRMLASAEESRMHIANADNSTAISYASTNQLEAVIPSMLTPMSTESSKAHKTNDQNGEVIKEKETIQPISIEEKPNLHQPLINSNSSIIKTSTSYQNLNIVNSSADETSQSLNPKLAQQSHCY